MVGEGAGVGGLGSRGESGGLSPHEDDRGYDGGHGCGAEGEVDGGGCLPEGAAGGGPLSASAVMAAPARGVLSVMVVATRGRTW
jgi:hypothetical protein